MGTYDSFSTGAAAVFKIDSTDNGSLVDLSEAIASVALAGTKAMNELKRIGNNQTAKVAGPVSNEWTVKVWGDTDALDIFLAASMTSGTQTRSVELGPFGTTSGLTKLSGEVVVGALSMDINPDDPLSFTVPLGFTGDGVTIGTYA